MKTLFIDNIKESLINAMRFMLLMIGLCAITGHLNTRCGLGGWLQSVAIFALLGVAGGIVGFVYDVIKFKLKEKFRKEEIEVA